MSCNPACLRLYKFINPYSELKSVTLTKEKEKHVLVGLSGVLSEIRVWIQQLDYCSSEDEDLAVKCASGSDSISEDNRCLAKIVSDLAFLLTVESQYVQHLAGNVLISVSEFLALSGSSWVLFLKLLCDCLRLAILNILSRCSERVVTATDSLLCDSITYTEVLSLRLEIANWSTVGGIIRVLRGILKSLNQDCDERLVQAYIDSISFCISKVPWDFLDEILVCESTEAESISNGETGSRAVFLGHLVQFLSSLVEQCTYDEFSTDSSNEHPLLLIEIKLLPKLLHCCLKKPEDGARMSTSEYFRHKLLVLMSRLSFQTSLENSTSVSWLELLQKYYWDLLQQPLSMSDSGQDGCLEGSPFLLAFSDQPMPNIKSHHLQRQVIFLFLRLSFSLISLSEQNEQQCMLTASNAKLVKDPRLGLECCYRDKGLLELDQWLKGQILLHVSMDSQLYLDKCTNFTLSFLRLYMHEDDVLFKVLLQLLSVPFCAQQQEKTEFQDLKEETIFHISNIFNPVHLFHLFLAELHYDHQVLLDCLISKDSGVSCAEYLLKCLRIVFKSWDKFVNFSTGRKHSNELSNKKRKVMLNGSILQTELSSISPGTDETFLLENSGRNQIHGVEHQESGSLYTKAKDCLLSLKVSVESLHQKELFPYNPEVLLRRLTTFEELCSGT